jgi:hypothetical protein
VQRGGDGGGNGGGGSTHLMGRVSANGRQVVPNPDVALYRFTGAMINSGRTPPGYGPGQGTPDGGDPVDLGTGLS